MAEKKKQKAKETQIYVTGRGMIKFPEFDLQKNEGGQCDIKFSIVIDPKDKDNKDLLLAMEQALPENANTTMYKDDFEKTESGDRVKTGKVIINLTSKYIVPMYDALRNKLPEDTVLGWGSICKVAIKFGDEFNYLGKIGRSKYPVGIQILDLKTSVYTAESVGFKDEEGYTVESAIEEPTPF